MTVTISQEALCEYCDRDSSRCEGIACERTREDFMSDYGLSESTERTFKDLTPADVVFCIRDQKIIKAQVRSVHNTENGFSMTIERCSNSTLDPGATSDTGKKFFIYKAEAITFYKKMITKTLESMMDHVIEFEKEQ